MASKNDDGLDKLTNHTIKQKGLMVMNTGFYSGKRLIVPGDGTWDATS